MDKSITSIVDKKYEFNSRLIERLLKKEGKIIVSMWYDKVKNNKLWKRIDSNFKIESQKTINNNKGISWIIKVLK